MKVGLTYDLQRDYLAMGYSRQEAAEFDRDDTIDAIEAAIRDAGHETDRIGNLYKLTARLTAGDRWDIVFNIAEGASGLSRESQVPSLLEAYNVPYTFSDPLVLAVALHKGMTKMVAQCLGVPTPGFVVVHSPNEATQVRLPYPLFAKPVAEGTSKGISSRSKIENAKDLRAICAELIATYQQPVLVETFLPGREFTVGILGTGDAARSVGVLEVHYRQGAEAHAYTFTNKENCEELIDYRLAHDTLSLESEQIALKLWKGLRCRDGGRVDLRVNAVGKPEFIEVNPLPGLNPVHSDLPIMCAQGGLQFNRLIQEILASAVNRMTAPANDGLG